MPLVKFRFALLFVPTLLLLPALVFLAGRYPFAFDDAFISYRITQNIITYGKPIYDVARDVNTSTSLVYPFWNLIWAFLFGEDWIEKIPVVNALLLVVAFGTCSLRIGQWFKGNSLAFSVLGSACMVPIFLDFRNVLYGNSGLETCLYMALIAILVLPGPAMAARYPVFSWWLILIRPEGFLAGISRFLTTWFTHQNREGWKSSLFWAFCSGLMWFVAGITLFESAVPQSLVAKSLHSIDRLSEWQKGFGYLLFANHPIELALCILAFWLVPDVRRKGLGALIFLVVYVAFFSGVAAWWPWYVPPLFVPFAYLTGLSTASLIQLASDKIKTQSVKRIGFLVVAVLVLGGSIYTFREVEKQVSTASAAFLQRKNASEPLGDYILRNLSIEKEILLEPIGLIGWFSPFHHFLDYPGLSNPKMSQYLEKRKTKIPHRLTDFKTDSAILTHFQPDYLILWREEKSQFEKIPEFEIQYWEKARFPYFPQDSRMDSVWIFEKLFDQPLN